MPDRVEVDVADLIALRDWIPNGSVFPAGVAALVAAIPPLRLVPTREAVEAYAKALGWETIYEDVIPLYMQKLKMMHEAGLLRDDCMEIEG